MQFLDFNMLWIAKGHTSGQIWKQCVWFVKQTLENVAYALYKDVVVATLDVSVFRAWAGSFVPHNYNKLHAGLWMCVCSC